MQNRRMALRVSAGIAGLALAAAACGGSSSGGGGSTPGNKNAGNVVKVQQGGEITYASEKNPANFNILTSDGNTFDTAIIVSPAVYPGAYIAYPDLSVQMNKDLLVSAELTNKNPQTVVYKIQQDAVWSDGTPISADDFKYAWTALNGKDTKYSVATTVGYDQIASVEGSDNGKTVTTTYSKPYADWKSLFGVLLPAHIMKTLDPDPHKAFNTGLLKPPTFSGGPYQIASFKNNDNLVLEKNPKWYGEKAALDKITFRIITDATQEPTALQNNEVQVIAPQPQIDLVKQVQGIQGVSSEIGFGLVFEHYDMNLKNPFLANTPAGDALRKAIFTAVDRQGIVDATVKQFSDKAAVLNSRIFVPGQKGYQDNVTQFGLGQGKVDDAKKILTDAGYKGVGSKLVTPDGKTVPAFRFRFTTGNAVREREGELLKASMKQLGADLKIEPTDDLGGTLDKRDFDIIVFAWVGTPFPFSANRDIYITDGGSNFDGYSNATVDKDLKDAAIQLDESTAINELNEADQQLTKDAVTLPLYQKPTFLAFYDKYGNIHDNPTSQGDTYNIQQWGVKAS